MRDYDVVIVGAGLAGLTAALTAARHGLSTAIVDQMGTGGQVLNVEKIENMPGFPEGIAGYDLGPIVQEQAEAAGAEFVLDTVEALEVDGDDRILRCSEDDLRARAVIIAAGSSLRRSRLARIRAHLIQRKDLRELLLGRTTQPLSSTSPAL